MNQVSHNLKFTKPKLAGSGLTAKPSVPVALVGTCSLSILRNAGFEPEEREDPEDREERTYLFCSLERDAFASREEGRLNARWESIDDLGFLILSTKF